MTAAVRDTSPSLNDQVRAEIRAVMARKQISNVELALKVGEDKVWVGRRITQSTRVVPLDMVDLERIATALDVPWWSLLPRMGGEQRAVTYGFPPARLRLVA